MSNRNLAKLLVLGAWMGVICPVWAQSAPEAQDVGAEPAYVEEAPQAVPMPISGDSASLAFSPELERSNFLRGGVSVGTTYDDNSLNLPSSSGPVGDLTYSVLPYIALDQTRPRINWTLSYAAGLIVNQRLSSRNSGSHDLTAGLRYRFSPHVTLRLHDDFAYTTGFSEQLQASPAGPGTGPINQPNQTVLTPLAKNLRNTGTADLSYQFGAGDMVGVSGTSYLSRFTDVPPGAGALLDSNSQEVAAFYSHRFTPRNWSGVGYRYQRLTFDPGNERALVHSLLLFHTIYLQPRMTLSFFGGPEYSQHQTETVSILVVPPLISLEVIPNESDHWAGVGGASFGWQGERTSVRLNVSRKVSDGGGLLGAVHLTSAEGAWRRQLGRSTAVNVGAVFGDNNPLDASVGRPSLKSASGNAALEQKLVSNLLLVFGYARDYESGSTLSQPGDINHNRGWVSLSYSFTRPLGR